MDAPQRRRIRASWRRLRMAGYTEREAGNLTGFALGMEIDPDTKRPWTPAELAHLDYLRWLVAHHRLEP
jgi:hypothetical protein